MGKHEGDAKKYKPLVPEEPDPNSGDRLAGGNGKHSGGKEDNKGNEGDGGKK